MGKSQAGWDQSCNQGRGREKADFSWQLELWTERMFFLSQSIQESTRFLTKDKEEDISYPLINRNYCKYKKTILGEGVKKSNGLTTFRTFNLQLCLVWVSWNGIGHRKDSISMMAGWHPHIPPLAVLTASISPPTPTT